METMSLLSTIDGAGTRRHDLALLPTRAALGATMLYHGIDKLRAHGRTTGMFESMGIRPAGFWARATAVAETFAGAAAVTGLLIRPAALAVLVTQAVAISKVHAPKGFSITKGGYEFNVALMAIATGLLLAGPGRYSGHHALSRTAPETLTARLFRRKRRRGLVSTLVRLLG